MPTILLRLLPLRSYWRISHFSIFVLTSHSSYFTPSTRRRQFSPFVSSFNNTRKISSYQTETGDTNETSNNININMHTQPKNQWKKKWNIILERKKKRRNSTTQYTSVYAVQYCIRVQARILYIVEQLQQTEQTNGERTFVWHDTGEYLKENWVYEKSFTLVALVHATKSTK